MADIKKFLDSQGTTYLWSKIAAELNKKADGSDLTALTTRVGTAESDIDALQALHAANKTVAQEVSDGITALNLVTTYAGKAYESKVDTLIGSDASKSVRTIANEELATQLIPANASESLDTLQEIAAWIQGHPGDASAMNSAITALQNKLVLGTDTNSAEYATVKAYVEAYVAEQLANSNLSQYALASDLDALEALVGNTAVATQIQNAITALDLANTYDAKGDAAAAEQAAKTYADGLIHSNVIGLTNAEIDAAIAAASASSSGT